MPMMRKFRWLGCPTNRGVAMIGVRLSHHNTKAGMDPQRIFNGRLHRKFPRPLGKGAGLACCDRRGHKAAAKAIGRSGDELW
jgi:hypothetical protein